MTTTPLTAFTRATDAVVRFETKFHSLRDDDLTAYRLECHGSEAKSLWEKVKSLFDECLDFVSTQSNATEAVAAADSKYDVAYNCYLNVMESIQRKLEELRAPSKHSAKSSRLEDQTLLLNVSHRSDDSHSSSVSSRGDNSSSHSLNLPPCDIDVFDGDFLNWPTFRDFFTAVYINNSRLSDIEKLCHLLKKTSGEARDVVSKFPLTHRSFALAWKALKGTYDNTRLLVNHQLKLLFDLPVLESETSSGLKKLQRGISTCISTMSIYDVATDDWDPILVFLCLQRLPKCTVTLWEQSIKDKSALSSWSDLDFFLTERIQTLTCLRDIRGIDARPPANKRIRSHFTNAKTTRSPSSTPPSSQSSPDRLCVLCRRHHHLRTCSRFHNLSVRERMNIIRSHQCCMNCLSRRHIAANCPSAYDCGKCGRRHHTLLHRETSTGPGTAPIVPAPVSRNPVPVPVDANEPSTSTGIVSGTSSRQVFHTSRTGNVLLGTAMVNIVHQGITYPARALIDPASESSFITEGLRNRLGLSTSSTSATISGVNQSVSITSRELCSLCIGTPLDESLLLETTAYVLPNISGNLPSFSLDRDIVSSMPNLRLADPNLFVCRPVDLLLGADLYPKIVLEGTRTNILGSLLAQNTVFGWVVTGPIPSSNISVFTTAVDLHEENGLDETLLRFWELEEIPRRPLLSASDKFCEDNYKRTTRRDSEGRYIVTLPLKTDFCGQIDLGNSRTGCLRQFLRNEASLLRKPQIKTVYDDVIREYLHLGHMRPVSATPTDAPVCYLPHHPVINPDKRTTKLRVVFNASNKTSTGNSLNDILHVGPTLQTDLVLLILRWRLYKFVYNCDITQMYRQIRVDPSQTCLQRILFRDSPQNIIQDYELQTVTFGVNCAPFLAIRTLLQLADDTENDFPLAAHILRRCMYVDDVLTGYHNLGNAPGSRGNTRHEFELSCPIVRYLSRLYLKNCLLFYESGNFTCYF
ncbi:uncharacterized protein LOC142235931 [Haematobia irritans]|uniref:uncharacterized protein LOC142235931 n=1 Tax=Haematobia irritans TaxID=7368 RepID=UPI003F4FF95A